MNLDPDGIHFWTGDPNSLNVWQVDIATGAIDQQWQVPAASQFFGLSVFGELTSGGGGTVPEPTSLALLGAGLAGFGLTRLRRKSA